ncbi:hypothetical protein [Nitratireductor sp. GZWM139]|uniref:hypothetical protein n=1 Tax=Nitratireductor sp. GZWM139 TaxID=2950541 RepID=UPI0024BDE9D6|nr:hypothetical protein [Nitratireductor sp. GZWM139]MDJ1463393.1 hypothetical protein [Nitratireductor sp. GZWM139]
MGQHSNDKVERSPRALWWAVGLSAIWVGVLAIVVSRSKYCPTGAPWWDVVSRYFACRSANEIGDFLAGASAPLAFIWLVVTVLVQAQELKAQRKELALTREEFQLNREVADETRKEIAAQAETARRSAELVGMQTKILSDQHAQQQKVVADETFKGLLEQLEIFLASRFHQEARYIRPKATLPDRNFHEGTITGDHFVRLSRRSGDIIRRVNRIREHEKLELCSINQHSVGLLELLKEHLAALCNMLDEASPVSRTLADTVRLLELQQTVEEVLQKMKPA